MRLVAVTMSSVLPMIEIDSAEMERLQIPINQPGFYTPNLGVPVYYSVDPNLNIRVWPQPAAGWTVKMLAELPAPIGSPIKEKTP